MAAPKFTPIKRPSGSIPDDTATLHLAVDPLESIYVYADELLDPATQQLKKRQGGSVTLVTQHGEKVTARLIKTWFPAGTWSIELDGSAKIKSFKPLFPADVSPAVIDVINRHSGKNDLVIAWEQTKANAPALKRLLGSASGRFIRMVISYSKAIGGNSRSLPETLPLTRSGLEPLADAEVARRYLLFVEHFGKVTVDFTLADNGLTEQELSQVEQNRPAVIAVTDLFLQAFHEFAAAKKSASPAATLDDFHGMAEAIFYQRNAKNDLASRNMLMIGMGSLLFTDDDGRKDLKPDIGVLRRTLNGGNRLLLYDRHGQAVRGMTGALLDTEHRSTDITKVTRDSSIPFLSLDVEDASLYRLLRSLEQDLGQPVREIEALVASYYKHAIFINEEIHRRYNGEIGQRLIAMAPIVIFFFVAHAFASYLITVNPPVGLALMLLLRGAGLVMGIDAALLDTDLLRQAGRHFSKMEALHRQDGDQKPVLTKLSEHHLHAGARALIDAMADILSMGVVIVGSLAAVKIGPALIRGIKNAAKGRLRLTVKDGKATEVETKEPAKEVETPKEEETAKDAEKAGLGGNEAEGDAHGTKPVDQPDAYNGESKKGGTPKQVPLEQKRPKALDQSPDDFSRNTPEQKAVQQELFDRAKEVVGRQNQFMRGVLDRLGIKDAVMRNELKRPTFDEFTEGVIAKIKGRKKSKYKTVVEMTDMTRGRIDLEKVADVEKVVNGLKAQSELSLGNVARPQKRSGVAGGYPRWHVDVIDPETGIFHEWQIGTKQTSKLFQEPGIDPAGVEIKHENTNIHDIEYDIFKSLDDPDPETVSAAEIKEFKELADSVGIGPFRTKVAQVAARTGKERVPDAELTAAIEELHVEASKIMKALVQRKGVPFVQHFLH